MLKFKILPLLSVLCLNFLISVRSECILNYPNNIETVPRYEKHIGKYRLQIPYNGNKIQLQEDEIISGYCDTQFSSIYYNVVEQHVVQKYNRWNGYDDETVSTTVKKFISNQTSITLTCRNSKLHYDSNPLPESTFECASLKWSIFATNDANSWCEKNQNSRTFLLAAKSTASHHILAGVCYNWEQLSLQTVNYNVTYSQRKDLATLMGISQTNLKSHQSLTDDLWTFKTTKISEISEELLQQQLNNLGKTNSWLDLANYEVASIVQGDSYGSYFKEYDNILNIIWWHNLRVGNWKRFMNTLENHAYNNSFELYTGTSDVVRFPTDQTCEQNNLLEIKIGFKNETLPGYIWTYLKSNENSNQDFIIVGYNSPYAEFFTLENIVFCPDICSEIPWLNKIQSSFRYSFAGIMFCCSTDFIRQTNYLHGFPMDVLMSRYLENTTEIEAPNEIEVDTDVEITTESKINLNDVDDDNDDAENNFFHDGIHPVKSRNMFDSLERSFE